MKQNRKYTQIQDRIKKRLDALKAAKDRQIKQDAYKYLAKIQGDLNEAETKAIC